MSDEKDWLVSDKTCKGCKYYGYLSPHQHSGMRCCNYTYYTGKVRTDMPKACTVKTKGRLKPIFRSKDGTVTWVERW